ncbi:MAG TPA: NAD+ synthase [Gemmatimonadaceae bacterium]|nr:NAD+ synthase [Gemmatimonadaceae bacterium]
MPPLVRLALAQVKPRKAEYRANLERIGALFGQLDALEERPQLLHLPETALTGYFLEGGVRESAVSAATLAHDLAEMYERAVRAPRTLDVVVGFYEVWRDTLHNAAMYVTLGAGDPIVRHVHRKTFLPTYGLFDEERFVERGHDIRAFDTEWGRAALLVCEDAWHSLTGTIAALDGAQIVFVSSAAPARGISARNEVPRLPGSVGRWERLIRDMAEEHGVFVALANLAGSEGGKVFPGASIVAGPWGELRARAPLWDESVLTATIDLADITRARADTPLLSDLSVELPHLLQSLERVSSGHHAPDHRLRGAGTATESGTRAPQRPESDTHADVGARRVSGAPRNGSEKATGAIAARDGAPHEQTIPIVRADGSRADGTDPLEIDPALVERWLTSFLRDEVGRRGFERVIVAISGGVDSAVAAFLCARALGAERVVGVRLPYRTSSAESLDHAQLVIDALGIQGETIDISPAVDAYLATQPDASPGRRGNVMARMRMIALFDLSARFQAIPIGTGNKTERLFGYFTWHADDSPPINPLGDLYKTQVWALARHLGVPEVIVGKPASADLIVGQTDEEDLGISYPRADHILHGILSGYSAATLEAQGFSADDIALVRSRLEGTHWKRRLPTVAMLSGTAIGESYLRPVDY